MLGIKRITGAADLAAEGEPGSWASDAAREKFMAAYERALALWPQPREEFDVETATATTRVHSYRPHPDGPPVVLSPRSMPRAGTRTRRRSPRSARCTGSTCPVTRTPASPAPR